MSFHLSLTGLLCIWSMFFSSSLCLFSRRFLCSPVFNYLSFPGYLSPCLSLCSSCSTCPSCSSCSRISLQCFFSLYLIHFLHVCNSLVFWFPWAASCVFSCHLHLFSLAFWILCLDSQQIDPSQIPVGKNLCSILDFYIDFVYCDELWVCYFRLLDNDLKQPGFYRLQTLFVDEVHFLFYI